MLTATILSIIIIFFPLYISVNCFFSKELEKTFFSIYLFGTIRILSGYAQIVNDGIAFHISKNKVYIFEYKNFFDVKNSVKPLHDYHLINFNSLIEIGSSNHLLDSMSASFILNYFNNIIIWFFANKKPYLKINNDINVYEGKNILNIYLKTGVMLNVLMIILSIIKICVEKIINGIKQRKQNKFGY